jgi:hypothetical protein
VINNPEEFRVRKQVLRKGKRRVEWVQMRKGVALASDAASSSAAMAGQAQHAPTSIASGAANSRAENLKKVVALTYLFIATALNVSSKN